MPFLQPTVKERSSPYIRIYVHALATHMHTIRIYHNILILHTIISHEPRCIELRLIIVTHEHGLTACTHYIPE